MDIGSILFPAAGLLAAAVVLDLLIGDPQYRAHPIRLMGHTVDLFERGLRRIGLDGYGGGILLALLMIVLWCVLLGAVVFLIDRWSHVLAVALHLFIVYSLLALRNLLEHAWEVERAVRANDLARARTATSMLVGRDTENLSFAECRRAAMESVSENLVDGYVSPLFWYVVGGLPGILLFKVFSTLDSMVGNKSERYLRFGWFSARMDDVLNWVPARLSWLLISVAATLIPACSARKALVVGWRQHGYLPSPNSGWSEAAAAGAIQRRLVGPIRREGVLVTELWLGDCRDPPAGEADGDVGLAMTVSAITGLLAVGMFIGIIFLLWTPHA